jgi:hypothetical protein
MFPIFEQGKGKGIGLTISSFHERFDELCHEHLRSKRAKAFAFIFYDFENKELRKILKDQGVFVKIDRLSGNNLSVFYLHSGNRAAVTDFNSEFLSKLGVADKATLPCVVFFKLKDDKIEDVAIAQLNSADLLHGFHELYDVIEHYIEAKTSELSIQMRSIRWIKSSVAFIGIEVFRAALKHVLEHGF